MKLAFKLQGATNKARLLTPDLPDGPCARYERGVRCWLARYGAPPRFMVCTSLTLIDPIVVRLMLWVQSPPSWNYGWVALPLTDLVILALIRLDRDSRRGRWVFRVMLPVFVAAQLPALLQVTATSWWEVFARWFAALPLT